MTLIDALLFMEHLMCPFFYITIILYFFFNLKKIEIFCLSINYLYSFNLFFHIKLINEILQ